MSVCVSVQAGLCVGMAGVFGCALVRVCVCMCRCVFVQVCMSVCVCVSVQAGLCVGVAGVFGCACACARVCVFVYAVVCLY